MKLFLKGLTRGAILFIFMLIVSLWKYFQGSITDVNVLLFNGLIILFLGISSVIYEIKSWSFFKQIIVHYITMLVTVFPTLLLSGYYPLHSSGDALNVFLLFNKVGVTLFVTTFIISRAYRKFSNRNKI